MSLVTVLDAWNALGPASYNGAPPTFCRRPAVYSMSIKSDHWIRRMAQHHAMIEPFVPDQVRVRRWTQDRLPTARRATATTSAAPTNSRSSPTSTRPSSTQSLRRKVVRGFQGDVCIIPPNSFALARTVEYFRIPRSVLTICVGKSTTPAAASSSTSPRLRAGMGGLCDAGVLQHHAAASEDLRGRRLRAQVLFFESDETAARHTKDRGGKYQGQSGVTLPKT